MRCCLLRTLMTYPGVPGYRGTQPLPDLAVAAPALSADGRTWTFKLKEGIHYAPPLDEVEITANDLVRALLRVGGEQILADGQPFGPGLDYLRVIEGFSEYVRGTSDSIAGVSTPDKYTLRVRTIRSDASLVHLFAMALTAPIPPLPDNPETLFGAATGHRFDTDFDPPLPRGPRAEGYGPFLIATGPYMMEGAPALEPSLPADQQAPIAGFAPAWWRGEDFRGRITLVRNPSWDPSTDRNRFALADRIEISVAPSNASLYRKLRRGEVDAIMGEAPPTEVVETYRSNPSLRGRVSTAALPGTFFASINVAEPPFDDPHVRRALALVLNRDALANVTLASQGLGGSITTHLVPDPMESSLLSSWNPFPTTNDVGDAEAARAEMDASRYGVKGRCAKPVCRRVLVVQNGGPPLVWTLRKSLRSLGIRASFADQGQINCADPTEHVAVCVFGWFTDYPDAGNMFVWLLSTGGINDDRWSLLGSTPRELRVWGYRERRVPSIDDDYERCAAQLGLRAALCWARLDQFVVGELVAVLPLASPEVVRLQGPNVGQYSLDQAFGEPSLDRLATARQ